MYITKAFFIIMIGLIGTISSISGLIFTIYDFPKKRRQMLRNMEKE